MESLRPSALILLIIVVGSAAALTLWTLAGTPWQEPGQLQRFASVAAVAALAYRLPISFSFKRRIYLDVIAIAMAAILLDPGLAALSIGLGSLTGQGLNRRGWDESLFNASQAVLQAGLGGLFLRAWGWDMQGLIDGSPLALVGVLILTGIMYTINSLLLAGVIGLQSGVSPLRVIADGTTALIELATQVAQVAVAVAAVVLARHAIWLLPLVLVPGAGLYLLLRHFVQQQKFAIYGMLESLADLVDFRDPYMATHSPNVARIATQIAWDMKLSAEQIDLIQVAARLHDLGRLSMNDSASERSGDLHTDEWNLMRQVPALSADLLAQFPETALSAELVRHHLERFDGEGFPDGLAGDEIPLGSRIIAVADALDAMRRHRAYRPALDVAEIHAELERFRGTQWDPGVVASALGLLERGELLLTQEQAGDAEQLPGERQQSARTIEQQIRHQAFHDPLTDLPNRLLLKNRMTRALAGDGPPFAALFIDLDGFKEVNDALGHRVGDQVLIEASRRIRGELRAGDFVARLGGDEFVALMWNIEAPELAAEVSERVILALGKPLDNVHALRPLAASIGIAMARPGQDTPDDVIHRADGAMYLAKRSGKGGTRIAAPVARDGVSDVEKHAVA
jgi:diguanylate cyclase (GGDEF)-like protein